MKSVRKAGNVMEDVREFNGNKAGGVMENFKESGGVLKSVRVSCGQSEAAKWIVRQDFGLYCEW